MYRTYVIIGFIGVLIGGWLLLRSVGGVLTKVKVPLNNPPVAGLYLPRGSQILSTEVLMPEKYYVQFKNQHGPELVLNTLEAQLKPLGYTVVEGESIEKGVLTMRPPTGRVYFQVVIMAPDFKETVELSKKLGKQSDPDALEKLVVKEATYHLRFMEVAEDLE
ncbi:hypothetical protein IT575_15035 [bacterium]|nr:hypothetical protein [bacterium]